METSGNLGRGIVEGSFSPLPSFSVALAILWKLERKWSLEKREWGEGKETDLCFLEPMFQSHDLALDVSFLFATLLVKGNSLLLST